MNIFASRRDILCQEMKNAYSALVRASESRTAYAQGWSDFGSTTCAMLTSQIPEFRKEFEQLRDICVQLSIVHRALAAAELRNAEDFRDVIERYAVVFRNFNEKFDAKERYLTQNERYRALKEKAKAAARKPNNESAVAKLNIRVEDAKAATAAALRALIEATEAVVTEKDKYNKFKIRRMRQGWARYTAALRAASADELRLFESLRSLISGIRVQSPTTAASVASQLPTAPSDDVVIQGDTAASPQLFDGFA